MQLWLPITDDGRPLTAQLAGPNSSGLIAVIICKNGHRIWVLDSDYQMSKWGIIWPTVWCQQCDWNADVAIENVRRIPPYREM